MSDPIYAELGLSLDTGNFKTSLGELTKLSDDLTNKLLAVSLGKDIGKDAEEASAKLDKIAEVTAKIKVEKEKLAAKEKEAVSAEKHRLEVLGQVNDAEQKSIEIQNKVASGAMKAADAQKAHENAAMSLASEIDRLSSVIEKEGDASGELTQKLDKTKAAYESNIKSAAKWGDTVNKVKGHIKDAATELTMFERGVSKGVSAGLDKLSDSLSYLGDEAGDTSDEVEDLGETLKKIKPGEASKAFDSMAKSLDAVGDTLMQNDAKWKNAMRIIDETTQKMKQGDAETSVYEDRAKGAAQAMMLLAKAGKENSEEFKQLNAIYKEAIQNGNEFKKMEERVATALEGNVAKMDAVSNTVGQMSTTMAAMGGSLGNIGAAFGGAASSVMSLKGAFMEIDKTSEGPAAAMQKMSMGITVGIQAAIMAFQAIDGAIREHETKIIEAGKSAQKYNNILGKFGTSAKDLQAQLDTVNELAAEDPNSASFLRGAIGNAEEFKTRLEQLKDKFRETRIEGETMAAKVQMTGGGLLGWAQSVTSNVDKIAEAMGRTRVAIQDIRTSMATASKSYTETSSETKNYVDGLMKQSNDMYIAILEKEGKINEARKERIRLMEEERDKQKEAIKGSLETMKSERDSILENNEIIKEQLKILTGSGDLSGEGKTKLVSMGGELESGLKEFWKKLQFGVAGGDYADWGNWGQKVLDKGFDAFASQFRKSLASTFNQATKDAGDFRDKMSRNIWTSLFDERLGANVEDRWSGLWNVSDTGRHSLSTLVEGLYEIVPAASEAQSSVKQLNAMISDMEKQADTLDGPFNKVVELQKKMWELDDESKKKEEKKPDPKKDDKTAPSGSAEFEKDKAFWIKKWQEFYKDAGEKQILPELEKYTNLIASRMSKLQQAGMDPSKDYAIAEWTEKIKQFTAIESTNLQKSINNMQDYYARRQSIASKVKEVESKLDVESQKPNNAARIQALETEKQSLEIILQTLDIWKDKNLEAAKGLVSTVTDYKEQFISSLDASKQKLAELLDTRTEQQKADDAYAEQVKTIDGYYDEQIKKLKEMPYYTAEQVSKLEAERREAKGIAQETKETEDSIKKQIALNEENKKKLEEIKAKSQEIKNNLKSVQDTNSSRTTAGDRESFIKNLVPSQSEIEKSLGSMSDSVKKLLVGPTKEMGDAMSKAFTDAQTKLYDLGKKEEEELSKVTKIIKDSTAIINDPNATAEQVAEAKQAVEDAEKAKLDIVKYYNEEKTKIQETQGQSELEIAKKYSEQIKSVYEAESKKLEDMQKSLDDKLKARQEQASSARDQVNEYMFKSKLGDSQKKAYDAAKSVSDEYEKYLKAGLSKEELAEWLKTRSAEVGKGLGEDTKDFQKYLDEKAKAAEDAAQKEKAAFNKQIEEQKSKIKEQKDLLKEIADISKQASDNIAKVLGANVEDKAKEIADKLKGETSTGTGDGKELKGIKEITTPPDKIPGQGDNRLPFKNPFEGEKSEEEKVIDELRKERDQKEKDVLGKEIEKLEVRMDEAEAPLDTVPIQTIEEIKARKQAYEDLEGTGTKVEKSLQKGYQETRKEMIKSLKDDVKELALTPEDEPWKAYIKSWKDLGKDAVKKHISAITDLLQTDLVNQTHNYGFNAIENFGIGFMNGVPKTKEYIKKALEEIKKLLEGHSPPIEGPLMTIDDDGMRVFQAWGQGALMAIPVVKSNIEKMAYAITETLSNVGTGWGQTLSDSVTYGVKNGFQNVDLTGTMLGFAMSDDSMTQGEGYASIRKYLLGGKGVQSAYNTRQNFWNTDERNYQAFSGLVNSQAGAKEQDRLASIYGGQKDQNWLYDKFMTSYNKALTPIDLGNMDLDILTKYLSENPTEKTAYRFARKLKEQYPELYKEALAKGILSPASATPELKDGKIVGWTETGNKYQRVGMDSQEDYIPGVTGFNDWLQSKWNKEEGATANLEGWQKSVNKFLHDWDPKRLSELYQGYMDYVNEVTGGIKTAKEKADIIMGSFSDTDVVKSLSGVGNLNKGLTESKWATMFGKDFTDIAADKKILVGGAFYDKNGNEIEGLQNFLATAGSGATQGITATTLEVLLSQKMASGQVKNFTSVVNKIMGEGWKWGAFHVGDEVEGDFFQAPYAVMENKKAEELKRAGYDIWAMSESQAIRIYGEDAVKQFKLKGVWPYILVSASNTGVPGDFSDINAEVSKAAEDVVKDLINTYKGTKVGSGEMDEGVKISDITYRNKYKIEAGDYERGVQLLSGFYGDEKKKGEVMTKLAEQIDKFMKDKETIAQSLTGGGEVSGGVVEGSNENLTGTVTRHYIESRESERNSAKAQLAKLLGLDENYMAARGWISNSNENVNVDKVAMEEILKNIEGLDKVIGDLSGTTNGVPGTSDNYVETTKTKIIDYIKELQKSGLYQDESSTRQAITEINQALSEAEGKTLLTRDDLNDIVKTVLAPKDYKLPTLENGQVGIIGAPGFDPNSAWATSPWGPYRQSELYPGMRQLLPPNTLQEGAGRVGVNMTNWNPYMYQPWIGQPTAGGYIPGYLQQTPFGNPFMPPGPPADYIAKDQVPAGYGSFTQGSGTTNIFQFNFPNAKISGISDLNNAIITCLKQAGVSVRG